MALKLSDVIAPPADGREKDYQWTLNFGPQHPATHTTLRLVLKLDGERVVDAMPEMGYLHSGFEKIGEHLSFNQYVTVTDRMNYISPMANNVAWHGAVETLLGSKVEHVRTAIAHGKVKRQGRFSGQRSDWKKAYVKLRQGEKLPEFFEGA